MSRGHDPSAEVWSRERRGSMSRLTAIIRLPWVLCAALAMLLGWFMYPSGSSAPRMSAKQLLLGPSPLGHGGHLFMERPQHGVNLPRLHVVGGYKYDEIALVNTYTFFGEVLKLRRPFTCLWDPRPVRWPALSGRQLKMIRAWVDANSVQWDTYVQAHALILTNPIVRALARMVIKLFAPPQPVRIVKSEEEALQFARTCCAKTRSYVKRSYADRDSRFSLFGSRVNIADR